MPTDGAVEAVPVGRNICEGVEAAGSLLGVKGLVGLGGHELGLGLRVHELRWK